MFIPIKYISEYRPEDNAAFFDTVIDMNIFVAASYFYETGNIHTQSEEDINNVKQYVETLLKIKRNSLGIFTQEGINEYGKLFSPYIGIDRTTGKRNIFATVTNEELFLLRDKERVFDGRKFESRFEDVRRFFFDCAIRSIYGTISGNPKKVLTHREAIYTRMVGMKTPKKGTYLYSIYRKKYTLQKHIKAMNDDKNNPLCIYSEYIGDNKQAYIITQKQKQIEEPNLFPTPF